MIPATTTSTEQALGGGATGGGTGPHSDNLNKTKDADEVVDVVIEDALGKDGPDETEIETDVVPESIEETEAQPMEEKSMANPGSGDALGEGRSVSEPAGSMSTKDSDTRSRPKSKSTTK